MKKILFRIIYTITLLIIIPYAVYSANITQPAAVADPADTSHDYFYSYRNGTGQTWASSFTRTVTGEMWQFDFQTPASGNKAIGITPYEMEDVLFYATNYDGTAVSATLSKCGLTSWVTCTAMSSAVTSSTIPAVASMVSTTLAAGEHFLVTLGTNTGTVTLLHTAITGTLLNVR